MIKSNVIEPEDRGGIADTLRDPLREGAQQLIQQAVGVELENSQTLHCLQTDRIRHPCLSTGHRGVDE